MAIDQTPPLGCRYNVDGRRRVIREMNAAKREVRAKLAGLVPRGEQRVLEDTGHTINYQRPDASSRPSAMRWPG